MKTAVINGKKYRVEYVFNMVGNWYFTDESGTHYLVDGEDVSAFGGNFDCHYEFDGTDTDGTNWYNCTTHDELAPSPDAPCARWKRRPKINVDTAIAYARHLAELSEDGTFWWTRKLYVKGLGRYVEGDDIERYLSA